MITKTIKQLLLILLVTGVSSCKKEVSEFVTLEGTLDYMPKGVEQISINEVVDGEQKELASARLDEEGRFGFHFKVENPGFYYVDYGQLSTRYKKNSAWVRLYLEPGMNLSLNIQEEFYEVSGTGEEKNMVVKKANDLYFQFKKFNRMGNILTYEEFFPFLEETGIPAYENLLEELKAEEGDFYRFMEFTVKTDFEESLLTFMFLPRVAHPQKEQIPQVYSEVIAEGVKFDNDDILKMGNGMQLMRCYMNFRMLQGRDKKVNPDKRYENHLAQIGPDAVREAYLNSSLKNMKLKSGEYATLIQPLEQYLTSEKSQKLLFELKKQTHQDAGQPGFEFTYKDQNGAEVAFSDFRGKYVYIDIWATWCSPCKKQIPYLKELEEEMKDENILFVSVSVDKPADHQKWLDFVAKENLGGVQLMADKAFESGIAENYDINAIPRFLIFDDEGRIVSTDAMRPSNPDLKNYLLDLMKS